MNANVVFAAFDLYRMAHTYYEHKCAREATKGPSPYDSLLSNHLEAHIDAAEAEQQLDLAIVAEHRQNYRETATSQWTYLDNQIKTQYFKMYLVFHIIQIASLALSLGIDTPKGRAPREIVQLLSGITDLMICATRLTGDISIGLIARIAMNLICIGYGFEKFRGLGT